MERMNKEIRPLEFGVAVALSLGGIGYSIARSRRIRTSKSPLTHRPSAELGDDYHALQQDKHVACRPRVAIDASISGLSPSIRSNGNKDGFLSPVYDDVVDDDATLMSDEGGCKCVETDYHDQEIKNLRNNIKVLKERERSLEVQLLEYYGLKEQETAVMELQNKLKINNVEAKLFNLKIESLQADNRRLQTQVAEYTKVVTDLEAAKSKVKYLKRKFRSEAEHNKEKISTLQKRLVVPNAVQDGETSASIIDPNTQLKLQKLKELEDEVEELRKSNYNLQIENTELADKLEYVQILATSVLEDQEIEKLKEEAQQSRKQNEDLTKEIEQLQGDRCADVEELVYLRWVNACLRHELRNYQQGQGGKNVVKDNSKTFSPKSEEKAKQLILEFAANKEGEKVPNMSEIDFDQWSSSQASCPTDSGELDESLTDTSSLNNKSTNSVKRKFFSKLKKLLKGKDGRSNNNHNHSRGSSEERNDCIEDESPLRNLTGSDHGNNSSSSNNNTNNNNRSRYSSRRSLDIPRSSPFIQRLKSVKSESLDDSTAQEQENGRKTDVRKYAEPRRPKPPKRSASFSSF